MSFGRIFRSPATLRVPVSRWTVNSFPKWTPIRCFSDDPPYFGTSNSNSSDKPTQKPKFTPSTSQIALYHAHSKPEFGCQFSLSSSANAVFLTVRRQIGPKPVRGVKSTQQVFDSQRATLKLSFVEAAGLSLFFGGQNEVFNLFHKANDGTTSSIKGQVKARDNGKYWSLSTTSEKYGNPTSISFDAAEARTLELYLIDAVRASFVRPPPPREEIKDIEGEA